MSSLLSFCRSCWSRSKCLTRSASVVYDRGLPFVVLLQSLGQAVSDRSRNCLFSRFKINEVSGLDGCMKKGEKISKRRTFDVFALGSHNDVIEPAPTSSSSHHNERVYPTLATRECGWRPRWERRGFGASAWYREAGIGSDCTWRI
jgi:hypothetical protein